MRSWALQLADAIAETVARQCRPVPLCSVRVVGDDALEITFSTPYDTDLHGMRVDRKVIETIPSRLMSSSLGEIAFDVVTMGICEPRRNEEFCEADESGVRWLPFLTWLADIS